MSNPTAAAALALGVGAGAGTLAVAPGASILVGDGSDSPELLCGADCGGFGGAAGSDWIREAAAGIQVVAADDDLVIPLTGHVAQGQMNAVEEINGALGGTRISAVRGSHEGKDTVVFWSDHDIPLASFYLKDGTQVRTGMFDEGKVVEIQLGDRDQPVLISDTREAGPVILWDETFGLEGLTTAGERLSSDQAERFKANALEALDPP